MNKIIEDLQAWRVCRRTGEEFTTPSGLRVQVRRVSLMDLAEQGGIPAPLVAMTDQILDRESHRLQVEDVASFADVINLVVKATVIAPRVEDEPTDTALGIREMPFGDRLAIYNWANRAGALATFREAE